MKKIKLCRQSKRHTIEQLLDELANQQVEHEVLLYTAIEQAQTGTEEQE